MTSPVPAPRGGRRRVVLAAMALTAALLSVGSAVGLGLYAWAAASRVTIPVGDGPDGGPGFDITGTCAATSCTYLLLGSDTRAGLTPEEQQQFGTDEAIGGENRSDTIILVRTDPRTQRAVFLSFPRDLWVDIPGHGSDKINAAFAGGVEGGGPQLVAATVTALTGIAIDHVLYVGFAGFQSVVDAIGGVDLCLPEPMRDPLTALDLPAGCQTLDGAQALAYVRTRHQPCDRIPDFARIARQQQFLRAIIAKAITPSQVAELPALIPDILGNLVVDRGLNPAELAYLAGRLQGIGSGSTDFRVVPAYPAWEGTKSVVKAVEPETNELFERLRTGADLGDLGRLSLDTAPSPSVIRVRVFPSAFEDEGGPARADALLVTSGFAVSDPGPVWVGGLGPGVPVNGAAVLFDPDAPLGELMARVVRRFLRVGVVVAAPAGTLPIGVDVAVVAGPAFRQGPVADAGSCV